MINIKNYGFASDRSAFLRNKDAQSKLSKIEKMKNGRKM
jgi:hypothetical protein